MTNGFWNDLVYIFCNSSVKKKGWGETDMGMSVSVKVKVFWMFVSTEADIHTEQIDLSSGAPFPSLLRDEKRMRSRSEESW